jgi:hypothetical protein
MGEIEELIPEGEDIRKAVRWVSERRLEQKDISAITLLEEACLRFDLSPKKAEFLRRFLAIGLKGEK